MSVKHIVFTVLLGLSVPVAVHASPIGDQINACGHDKTKSEQQQYRCIVAALWEDGKTDHSAWWSASIWYMNHMVFLTTQRDNGKLTQAQFLDEFHKVSDTYNQIRVFADIADKERVIYRPSGVAAGYIPPLPTPSPQEPLLPVDEFPSAPKQTPHRFHRVSIPTAGFTPAPALPPPPEPGSLLPKTYNINTWGNTATITGPNGNVTHCMGGYGGTVTCN